MTAPSTRLDRRTFLTGAAALATAATLSASPPAYAAKDAKQPSRPPNANDHGPGVLQDWYRTLYSGLMTEGAPITPGRAARIYANVAIAGYEVVVASQATKLISLAGQLNGLSPGPKLKSEKTIDWPAAVSTAIATTAGALLRNASTGLRNAVTAQLATHLDQRRNAGVPQASLDAAQQHGQAVGTWIAAWAAKDGAEATYDKPYTPPVGPTLWESTAPNFGTAIDPYWGSVRPMALATSDACKPRPPVAYSEEPGSPFHDQAMAVLAADAARTAETELTALFWRDNPITSGLPSGHWMRIVAQVSGDRGLTLAASAEALAMAGITLNDAFISCWQEKYTTNLLRPITYIQRVVPDHEDWLSFVNTPQFPEYTSGHSVASQAVATVLTAILGSFPFTDRTHELRNPQLGSRDLASFQAAADQAANSRLLGGIHYPMGIEAGMEQGDLVGRTVLARVRTRPGRR